MSITLICIVCLKLCKKKILYEYICWLTAFARARDSGNLKLGWSVDQQSTDCNQTVLLLLTVFMKYIHCL